MILEHVPFLRNRNMLSILWLAHVLVGEPASASPGHALANPADSRKDRRRMSDEDAILAANAAYYRAFSAGDVAAMSRIWADDDVSCVHPGWTPLVGRPAVFESYRSILTSPTRVRIAHRNDAAIVT